MTAYEIVEDLDENTVNTTYVACNTLTIAKRRATQIAINRLNNIYIYVDGCIVAKKTDGVWKNY